MKYRKLTSTEEALQWLSERGNEITLLAGGTDVMVQLDRGEIQPHTLGYIGGLASELAGIKQDPGGVSIGTLTCHRQLAQSELIKQRYAGISVAAAQVGGWQTQYAGTLGGNICNASPAADLLPPLLVHGAKVRLLNKARGERILPLGDFLLGRRHTARQPDELLVDTTLEPVPDRTVDIYIKVGRRSAMEVAIAGLAVRLSLAEDANTITDIRIATCAVGPVPCRAPAAEAILQGQAISRELLREAGVALVANTSPIDDVRGSAAYRQRVLPRLLESAIRACATRINQGTTEQRSTSR